MCNEVFTCTETGTQYASMLSRAMDKAKNFFCVDIRMLYVEDCYVNTHSTLDGEIDYHEVNFVIRAIHDVTGPQECWCKGTSKCHLEG